MEAKKYARTESQSASKSDSHKDCSTFGQKTNRKPYERHVAELWDIPLEIADLPIWCAWKLVKKPGKKPDKMPVSPKDGSLAWKEKKATFCTNAEQAIHYAESHKHTHGIGFILYEDASHGIIGGDIDHCLDPETGNVSEKAKAIIREANTYTEQSPGLNGFRFIARGTFGGYTGNNSEEGVELYEGGRFLTFTGYHLEESPFAIENRDLTELGRKYRPKSGKASNGSGNATQGDGMSLQEISLLLACIPNKGEGQGYDEFQRIAAAISYETGASAEGFHRFNSWCKQSDKYDAEKTRVTYYSFDHTGDKTTTGKTLQFLAMDEVNKLRTEKEFEGLDAGTGDKVFTPANRGHIQLPDSFRETVVGKLASRASYCLEFPEASTAMALLAGGSAAVATSYAVQYQTGTPIPAGIYAVIEQPPSMRKSQLLNYAQMPYLSAMGNHNRKVMQHNAKLDKNDPKARQSFTVTTDPTTAGLDMTLADCSEGRFFVASAEQAAFQSLFPEKGDFASHNGLLLQGWGGEYAAAMRKGRNAFSGFVSGSIMVIAQSGSAARVFNASNGTGLAERFFYLAEPTTLGSRTLHGDFVHKAELEPFEQACKRCIEDYSNRRFAILEQPQDPEDLWQLRLNQDGYDLLLRTRRTLEPKLGKLAKDGELLQVGWLGKIETHTLKIAASLHVIEYLSKGKVVPELIDTAMVQTALDLVKVLAEHFSQLLHDSGETGEAAEIDSVMDLVMRKPYKVRPLAQALRNRHPFRAMGKESYTRAKFRIEQMLSEGRLKIGIGGKIEAG